MDYEADLERNIEDLHNRAQRRAYRALPSRRVYHLADNARSRLPRWSARRIREQSAPEIRNSSKGHEYIGAATP
jgi:hypothetical protein